MSAGENATSDYSSHPKGRFDAAWLGLIPAAGWLLAYSYELGHFFRHDVPAVFIELSLTQVIKAVFSLLAPGLLWMSMANSFHSLNGKKAAMAIAGGVMVMILSLMVFARPPEERWETLTAGVFAAAFVVVALLFAGAGKLVESVRREMVQLFHAPTLFRFLLVAAMATTLCVLAIGLGHQGGAFKTPPIVQDTPCGPLPLLVGRAGDTLIIKLPPEKNEATRIRLLSTSEAKNLSFRSSSTRELRFRNADFVGPCYREKIT